MRYRSWILLALFCVACEKLPPEQEHYQRGLDAYSKGDFQRALLYLKPLVENNHPAAQLIMAKMYAHGDGVPEDIEKSEVLRNSAAMQILKKKNLAPGLVKSDNATLVSISNRLDYYVGAGERKSPPPDIAQILNSINAQQVDGLNAAGADLENAPAAESAASLPQDSPVHMNEPEPTPQPISLEPKTRTTVAVPDRPLVLSGGNTRRSDQISLTLIKQAAEKGDPMAMELLSAAYERGFYSVKISSTQAALWAQKAKLARESRVSVTDEDPDEQRPMTQVWLLVGVGIALVGVGLWRWQKTKGH